MLILTRKKDQSIIINDDISVTILRVNGNQVRVGIEAPKDVSIFRNEIYKKGIKKTNIDYSIEGDVNSEFYQPLDGF